MISLVDAQKHAKETLNGFPSEVVSAYLAFAENGEPKDLDCAVLGVLNFYLAKKPKEPIVTFPGTTRLVEGLGCDSLTMMDTVFTVESIFDVKIDDTELANLQTLDDLRNYMRRLKGVTVTE